MIVGAGGTSPDQTRETPKDLSTNAVYIRARGGWGRGGCDWNAARLWFRLWLITDESRLAFES